ncbi:hypothetical protein JTE90_024233 [Oedothorax gibbosus]|uniref:G-protein coupled receptors family 1 profile domain-containing protein n=1 Tax=Oedothorax gibbosus TaxID=931172 RepID=A0AAV6TT25_9ARAC|nr:hypothetical protein JTE90_024233 [Oedothorax gibbosus]
MMITVVSVFTLCWLPLNALIVAGDEHDSVWQFPHIVYIWFVCHWLAMSSTAYNPLIYCWMNSKYRDGFIHVFRHLLPCLSLSSKRRGMTFNSSINRNGFNRGTNNTIYTSIRSSGCRTSQISRSLVLVKGHHKVCARTDSDRTVQVVGTLSKTVKIRNGNSEASTGLDSAMDSTDV